jgi:kynurenine 3-monooxygenase
VLLLGFLRSLRLLFGSSHASNSSANDYVVDLRDPSIVPLNFTKSINLALSERGLYAMKQSGESQLVDHVMSATIPMRGRMIHGQSPNGTLYEHSQNYGVDDQVRNLHSTRFYSL